MRSSSRVAAFEHCGAVSLSLVEFSREVQILEEEKGSYTADLDTTAGVDDLHAKDRFVTIRINCYHGRPCSDRNRNVGLLPWQNT